MWLYSNIWGAGRYISDGAMNLKVLELPAHDVLFDFDNVGKALL